MLDDRTVLVVGATAGIGAATYRLCCQHGAKVIGIGRNEAAGRALEDECGGRFVVGDITDTHWLAGFFTGLSRDGVQLDGAVNNAGMSHAAIPLDDLPLSLFDQVFALNVRATFACLQHEMAAMRSRGGAIVNVASIAGKRGFAGLSAYSASKHAVIGLTRAAALDGAARGIRVNAVLPGTTRTAMFEMQMESRPGGAQGTIAGIPLGRASQPDEQAAAIAWLLSGQSSFVTGETLTADGGATIR